MNTVIVMGPGIDTRKSERFDVLDLALNRPLERMSVDPLNPTGCQHLRTTWDNERMGQRCIDCGHFWSKQELVLGGTKRP